MPNGLPIDNAWFRAERERMTDRDQAIRDIVSQYGPTDPKLITDPTTLPLALPSFGQAEISGSAGCVVIGLVDHGQSCV